MVKQTPRALQQLRKIQLQEGVKDSMLKLSMIKKGCNGLSYKFDVVRERQRMDEVVQEEDVRMVLDGKSLMLLIGTEVDFVEDDLRSEFVFKNPKAKSKCGCGESFEF